MKKVILSALLLTFLAACSTVKVDSWSAPEATNRKMGKTAILAIADSDALARQYEDIFVQALSEKGVQASALHTVMNISGKLTKETLTAALKKNGYTSIIITRKLSEAEQKQVHSTFMPTYYDDYYGYYAHYYPAFPMGYNSTQSYSFTEFSLESNLYDVQTQKLIWSGRQIVYDDRSDESNLKGMVKGLVKDLAKKGML